MKLLYLMVAKGLLLKSAFVLLLLTLAGSVLAAPSLISFQGKLVNQSSGTPFSTTSVMINITTLGDTSSVLWSNTYNNFTDGQGVFSTVLGSSQQLNLTAGQDYNLVLCVDLGTLTFAGCDLVYGDGSPAGDDLVVNPGGARNADELVLARDNVTTVETEFARYALLVGANFTGNVNTSAAFCLEGVCITSWNTVNSTTDTDTKQLGAAPYLYNDSSSIIVNETALNATIDARAASADTDTDTVWNLITRWLFNNSGSLDFNETRLNSTIDARDSDTTYDENDPYLVLTGTTFSVDESELNSTIDARVSAAGDTDTVWTLVSRWLFNNSGSLDFNETRLNATIDARAAAVDTDTNFWTSPDPTIIYNDTASVGIGTPTPAGKLQIDGGALYLGNASQDDGDLLLRFNTARPWDIENGGSGASSELWLQSTVDSKYFRIRDPAGNNELSYYVRQDPNSVLTLHNSSLTIEEGSVVLNELGVPTSDFRVESDTDANMIFVDASSNRVGIGTGGPAGELDVDGSLCISGDCIGNWASVNTSVGDTPWSVNVNDMIYNDSARLGIGTDNPNALIDVYDSESNGTTGSTDATFRGVNAHVDYTGAIGSSRTATVIGISGSANGSGTVAGGPTTQRVIGVQGIAYYNSGVFNEYHYGGHFTASAGDEQGGVGNAYGVYATATGGEDNNWGIYSEADSNYFSGDVGVGTNSPDAIFHLINGSGPVQMIIESAPDQEQKISFRHDGGDEAAFINSDTNNGLFIINTTNGMDTVFNNRNREAMRLEYSTGDVGINTPNPLYTLHVNDITTGSSDTMYLTSGATSAGSYVGLVVGTGTIRSAKDSTTTFGGGGDLTFLTRPDAPIGVVERMIIDHSGQVGMGTSTPAEELVVADSSLGQSYLQLEVENDGATAGILFNGSTDYEIQSSSGDDFFIYDRTNTRYNMFINEQNEMALGGYTTPDSQLELRPASGATQSDTPRSLYAYNSYSGTTTAYGIYNQMRRNVASAATNYGIYNLMYSLHASATGTTYGIYNQMYGRGTNNYGEYTFTQGSGTNTYGQYISMGSSATNEIGLYITGEDYNYFSGDVGIGKVPSLAELDVVGDLHLTESLGINYDSFDNGLNAIVANGSVSFFTDNDPQGLPVLQLNTYGTYSPSLRYVASRGTVESASGVVDGDTLLDIHALGHDGSSDGGFSDYAFAGGMEVRVDGTPGNSDMPTELALRTTPDGDNQSIDRLVIDNAGQVGINRPDPAYLLDSAGTFRLGAGIENASRFGFRQHQGTFGSSAYYEAHDAGGSFDCDDVCSEETYTCLSAQYVNPIFQGDSSATCSVTNAFPKYCECDASCFDENTPVLMGDGTYKRIGDIELGDVVASWDNQTNSTISNTVIKIEEHFGPRTILTINEHLNVTPDHRMYLNDQWVQIGEAKLGDYLRNEQGEKVWIFSIEESVTESPVYNLLLEQEQHNYFADGLLAHNKCPFLYALLEDGSEAYETTIIYNLEGKEAETTQDRELEHLTNKFILRELEPEQSYIDQVLLVAVLEDGSEVELLPTIEELQNIDADYFVTTQGDEVVLEFEELPENTVSTFVRATGYYEFYESDAMCEHE